MSENLSGLTIIPLRNAILNPPASGCIWEILPIFFWVCHDDGYYLKNSGKPLDSRDKLLLTRLYARHLELYAAGHNPESACKHLRGPYFVVYKEWLLHIRNINLMQGGWLINPVCLRNSATSARTRMIFHTRESSLNSFNGQSWCTNQKAVELARTMVEWSNLWRR